MTTGRRTLAVVALGALALAAVPVGVASPLVDVQREDDGAAVVSVEVPGLDVPDLELFGADPLAGSSPQETLPEEIDVDATARWGVAVLEPATGLAAAWGDQEPFETASAVKVDVLGTLLLQAQGEDRSLTEGEKSLAEAMIVSSDNDATTVLLEQLGGLEEVSAFHRRAGVEGVELDPEGDWGLTRSTVQGRIAVLEAVLEPALLSPARREYATELLTGVVPEQRFGVSVVADDPERAALKVGFVPDEDDVWTVTSSGRVVAEGRTLLLAVMSEANADYDAGVDLTEQVARRAARALLGVDPGTI